MDLRIEAVKIEDVSPNEWDIIVDKDNEVETVDETTEIEQMANIAMATELHTIPQLENIGIDWLGYLFKEKSLTEIDFEIRQALMKFIGDTSFIPAYSKEGDSLVVKLGK